MAFGATTYLDTTDRSTTIGREWDMVEVDCTLSTIAVAAPRQLVPIYDNEGIDVLGLDTVTAGTANAVINLGIHNASATAIDEDYFIDVLDVATGVFTPSPGGTAPSGGSGGRYVNRTGATVYLTIDADTQPDSAGKYRVYYKKFPVPEVV